MDQNSRSASIMGPALSFLMMSDWHRAKIVSELYRHDGSLRRLTEGLTAVGGDPLALQRTRLG